MRRVLKMMRKSLLKNNLEVLQFPRWKDDCNISHFVTLRSGGVSKGNYSSMNPGLYTSDNIESIARNRQILCEGLQIEPKQLITPRQTHSDRILSIDAEWLQCSVEEQTATLQGVDALITDQAEVCLTVSTADCVPILLYSPDRRVIAAVHAGWRGTVAAILQKTVQRMKRDYGCTAYQIHAAIGPSISLEAFEVGMEVVDAFRNSHVWTADDMESLLWWDRQREKYHIDLWKANRLQLLYEGLLPNNINQANICTFATEELFSARRMGVESGRILSGILMHKK